MYGVDLPSTRPLLRVRGPARRESEVSSLGPETPPQRRRHHRAVPAVVATAAALAFTTSDFAGRSAAGGTLVVNINTGPATIDPRDMTSFFDTIGLNSTSA